MDAAPRPDATGTRDDAIPNAIVPPPDQQAAFLAALEKAPDAARRLARASGHEAAIAAADVLAAMADALEALPDPDGRVGKDVGEVRFGAKRLRRSDRLSFNVPKWVKEGLTSAVYALEKTTSATDRSRFWLELARQAQTGIDTKSSLTFQRAPVQDAVRTTLDAFIVVGQGLRDTCP